MPADASVDTLLKFKTATKLKRQIAAWLTNLLVSRNLVLGYIVGMCTHAETIARTMKLSVSEVSMFYDREVEHINQLFNLLVSYLSPERYASLVPPPEVLAQKYGLTWQWAVLFGRPVLSQKLSKGLKEWATNGTKIEVKIVEFDKPATAEEAKSEGPAKEDKKAEEEKPEAAVAKSEADSDNRQPRVVRDLQYKSPLIPRSFVDYITKMLPASSLERGITADFVAAFWLLTMYDIEVPGKRVEVRDTDKRDESEKFVSHYEKEIKTIETLIKRTRE
ncbi:hypothetical protein FBU59_007262, partial [Linderina macrospora]